MTCIAAVVHKQKIYMGCDSAVSYGNHIISMKNSKIFEISVPYRNTKEKMLIGVAGSLRIGNLVEAFEPPKRTTNIDKYISTVFSADFREYLNKNGALRTFDGSDNVQLSAIIGYKKALYTWCIDFSVMQPINPFSCVGSGGSARAVLWALQDTKISPSTKIRKALEYATIYCDGVKPPYKLYTLYQNKVETHFLK